MNWIETVGTRLRHLPGVKKLDRLWDVIRPLYHQLVERTAGREGLPRCMNGMDRIRILPELRMLPETYEPEVWRFLMPQVRPGDCIADIGAHYGLYAIAMAQRTEPAGRVLAFEPDPANVDVLRRQIALNHLESVIEVIESAVTGREGSVDWHSQDTQSVAKPASSSEGGTPVAMTTLDRVCVGRKVDIMLIDIEGYEEPALRGGQSLLKDPNRRPRLMVIEVHPYNWGLCGGSSVSLLDWLRSCGYEVRDLAGKPVTVIESYGHVVAVPTN